MAAPKPTSDSVKSESLDHGLPRRWITIFLMALTASVLVALLLDKSEKTPLAFCLIVCGTLSICWPLIEKIDNIKIGATGVELSQKVDAANEKADDASNKAYRAIETITRFVFNSMPQPTFENLQKIRTGRFGPFHMGESFRQQLRTLRDSGYILTNNLYISAIPTDGDELSDYVYCTKLGKEFIDRRLAAEDADRQRILSDI